MKSAAEVLVLLSRLSEEQVSYDAHTVLFHVEQLGLSYSQILLALRSATVVDDGGLPDSCIVEFPHEGQSLLCRFDINTDGITIVGFGWR